MLTDLEFKNLLIPKTFYVKLIGQVMHCNTAKVGQNRLFLCLYRALRTCERTLG
ncbi:hypothetical protein EV294_108101 [Paenibacillus sp. BK033]|nr:hypothetical protein EV294_108101 [Paenibacillus sp. BK033]